MNYHHEDSKIRRVSRVFELHDWAVIQGEDNGTHVPTLAKLTIPVYMQARRPEVPTSLAYPLEAMCSEFALPHTPKAYFTNTISYMVALAITEGFAEIQLFGVDMAQDTEYASQRPSCEFFLGIAVGRGVRVVPHPASDILKTTHLYGFEERERQWLRDKIEARRTLLITTQHEHERQRQQHADAVQQFAGALQELDNTRRLL